MNYEITQMHFASADGKNTIYAEIYTPKGLAPVGVIQLVHGMVDYTGRYHNLIAYFCSRGYVVAGHHQLGHGKSAACDDDLGFFANKGGVDFVLRDVYTMNRHLVNTFPGLPLVILGHSMGSFITRLYIQAYPHSARGVIIHGTAGPNRLLPFGRALAAVVRLIHGPRYRSGVVTSLAIGAYNKKFPKDEGENAWLTRDVEAVKGRQSDRLTSFVFTVSAYQDLFRMLGRCNSSAWFRRYPDIPTLIVSGEMDPVGNFGKGPRYVYKQLILTGHKDVSLKLYDGARHELFYETNKDEVFADIEGWLSEVAK